mmetsp:Transcript_34382/g.50351  ORF Transcript_34382/g.50351 Transcript_34382/m.50351 type:complete len:83 (+) Transcript_34382:456-704(+)
MATDATSQREGSPKQARFHENSTKKNATIQHNTVSPIKLAISFLKNKHATLLHPEIIIIITCFHLEFIKLKIFIYNKTNILK